MYKLTEKQIGKIVDYMNPKGHNYKDVNWIKVIDEDSVNENVMLEVGYWITYLNCKPKYNKDIVYLSYEKLDEFNQ